MCDVCRRDDAPHINAVKIVPSLVGRRVWFDGHLVTIDHHFFGTDMVRLVSVRLDDGTRYLVPEADVVLAENS